MFSQAYDHQLAHGTSRTESLLQGAPSKRSKPSSAGTVALQVECPPLAFFASARASRHLRGILTTPLPAESKPTPSVLQAHKSRLCYALRTSIFLSIYEPCALSHLVQSRHAVEALTGLLNQTEQAAGTGQQHAAGW